MKHLTIERKAELFDQLNQMIVDKKVFIYFGENESKVHRADGFICSESGYAGILINPVETIACAKDGEK